MYASCEEHLEAIYFILRYLKGTLGKMSSLKNIYIIIRQEALRPSQMLIEQVQLRIGDLLQAIEHLYREI